MKDYTQLKCIPIFKSFTDEEIQQLLPYIPYRRVIYSPHARIMHFGQDSPYLGYIVSGKAHVERIDYWGNRSLYEALLPGYFFSQIYSCGDYPLNIQITAAAKTDLFLIDISQIKHTTIVPAGDCNHELCLLQIRLLQNILQVLADKAYQLSRKMEWTVRCSIKDRVSFYLSQQAHLAQSNTFDIPLNRQELADHLFVDRSALSNALCKMRDDGLLRFKNNHFELLENLKQDEI